MRLKILFHDNCFDGAASAAIFARFYRERVDADAEVAYQGMQHKPGEVFPPGAFDGDVNACVDFRYSRSPRLDWWFDHHQSAFPTPEDLAHFQANPSERKAYDPAARSCAGFEAAVLAARFGFDRAALTELIGWAEIVDGALFASAAVAVELAEPALQLMTWVENNHDVGLKSRFIEDLAAARPLADIAADAYVQAALTPLLERHRKNIDLVRAHAVERGGVIIFDLLDTDAEAPNKFIPYWIFPRCRYAVGLVRSPARVKISVGSNPWSEVPRTHNIAAICERYGGGGHPVVGAISLPADQTERARQIAGEIAGELSQ